MPVIDYDLRVEGNTTWRRNFLWTSSGVPQPLGGAHALWTVRRDFGCATILTLTDGGGITLLDGQISMVITAQQIETIRKKLSVSVSPFYQGIHALVVTYASGEPVTFMAGKYIGRRTT